MPKEMEMAMRKQAKKMGLLGKEKDAYIYGGMRRAGWKPKKGK
jgi:hypothetical protein